MAKAEPTDTYAAKRPARRAVRAGRKESGDLADSRSAEGTPTRTSPERDGAQESASPEIVLLGGMPELVAATREQTAAIERQTAVMERFLTYLSPAAAAQDRKRAASHRAGPDGLNG